jgi:large subunit ribosomal protein L3
VIDGIIEMTKGILGRKVGMTQIYRQDGSAVSVTVIEAGPCTVTQVRTLDRDGYEGVQMGFGAKPRHLSSRSERGHVASIGSKRAKARGDMGVSPVPKAGGEPMRFLREFRGASDLQVGSVIKVDVMEGVKAVDVIGKTKGCGYAGVMKRHNFAGQRATHGVKKCHRHPGGTQAGTYPGHLIKGRKMAGRYGNDRVTARNLDLVGIDKENNLLLVHGAVPGAVGGYVIIRATNKLGS